MRIKTWLLLSYLMVMLLPLVAAYVLFAWIFAYNDEKKVDEYLQVLTEIEDLKHILEDPSLYQPKKASYERLEDLASDRLSIVLYNSIGLIMYSSHPAYYPEHSGLSKEQMYEDLYELVQGYRTYTYKQPVLVNKDLVGFFQVEIARDDWVSAVSDRTLLVSVLFIVIFIIIFLGVIWLVNKKINIRLKQLMNEMTAFARGEPIQATAVNNDEIGQLKKHFYKMRREIDQAQETITEEQRAKEYMIASISHDLKTPLTSIKAYAESLQGRFLKDEEEREYKQVIVDKANYMQEMLDDLLIYTLLQSPTYEMDFVFVDGAEFFDMLVSGYDQLCQQKGMILSTDVAVEGTYKVDPQQMIRVIDNLMSNAIQHSSEGGQVILKVFSKGKEPKELLKTVKERMVFKSGYAYIVVQNEGQGIDEDQLRYVFDPLYQGDQSRNKREELGTGLGLSISRKIIEKHGGRINMFTELGKGTAVVWQLPKRKEGAENDADA